MTHLDDEETRHAFGLPESAIAVTDVTRVNEDFRDSWYLENLDNSSAEIRIDFFRCIISGCNMGRINFLSLIPKLSIVML